MQPVSKNLISTPDDKFNLYTICGRSRKVILLRQNLSLTINHPLRQCCPWKSTNFLKTNWNLVEVEIHVSCLLASTLSTRPGNITSSFGQIGIHSTGNLPSGSARITWGSSHEGQVRKSTRGYCTGKGNEATCRHVVKVWMAFLVLQVALPFILMKSLHVKLTTLRFLGFVVF